MPTICRYDVFCSARCSVHSRARTCYYTVAEFADSGKVFVDDHAWFNSRYHGLSLKDALVRWSEDPNPLIRAVGADRSSEGVITYDELLDWQREVVDQHSQRENKFGRKIDWCVVLLLLSCSFSSCT
jgi:hypothetical protein